MKFANLNRSPMAHGMPAWQQEVLDRVEQEFSEQAAKINDVFRKAALEKLSEDRFLPGRAIMDVMRNIPRYAYIKNIKDSFGLAYDAEIDLLCCTVAFIQL